jgi:hypothetical protein
MHDSYPSIASGARIPTARRLCISTETLVSNRIHTLFSLFEKTRKSVIKTRGTETAEGKTRLFLNTAGKTNLKLDTTYQLLQFPNNATS